MTKITLSDTPENNAKIKALRKISGTKWVGNTTHDTIDKCLVAINLDSNNKGSYIPQAARIKGLQGIFLINEDGSLFCEARIIKQAEKEYLIEYLTNSGWDQFEEFYCNFIDGN